MQGERRKEANKSKETVRKTVTVGLYWAVMEPKESEGAAANLQRSHSYAKHSVIRHSA